MDTSFVRLLRWLVPVLLVQGILTAAFSAVVNDSLGGGNLESGLVKAFPGFSLGQAFTLYQWVTVALSSLASLVIAVWLWTVEKPRDV